MTFDRTIGVALLVFNPNLLYLQATPMTEPLFYAGIMALLYFTPKWIDDIIVMPALSIELRLKTFL